MAIKVDLTEEPYFGIIRRWALRKRRGQRPRSQHVRDWDSPELRELAVELVSSIVQKHMVTAKELARLTAAVHHTLVQLGASRMQQMAARPRDGGPRLGSPARMPLLKRARRAAKTRRRS